MFAQQSVLESSTRKKRSSSISKFIGVAAVAAAIGIFAPKHFQSHIDEIWVAEAHQALLTVLVNARNYAWENGTQVELCMVNAEYQCVLDYNEPITGWMGYRIVETRAGQLTKKRVAFHRFNAEYVALANSARMDWSVPLGFDDEGYSLQREVVSFDIYSISGMSSKTYKVIVEPSGALQTLVNAEMREDIHVALSSWPERQRELGLPL